MAAFGRAVRGNGLDVGVAAGFRRQDALNGLRGHRNRRHRVLLERVVGELRGSVLLVWSHPCGTRATTWCFTRRGRLPTPKPVVEARIAAPVVYAGARLEKVGFMRKVPAWSALWWCLALLVAQPSVPLSATYVQDDCFDVATQVDTCRELLIVHPTVVDPYLNEGLSDNALRGRWSFRWFLETLAPYPFPLVVSNYLNGMFESMEQPYAMPSGEILPPRGSLQPLVLSQFAAVDTQGNRIFDTTPSVASMWRAAP